jgi:hypothetical protein
LIQAANVTSPRGGRFFFLFAAALLLAGPAGAVETVWQKGNDFVRLEKADGGTTPSSLPKLSADAVRAVLASVQVSGDGETGPLLESDQLSLIAGPIAKALAQAGPGQDVAFAVHVQSGILDYLGPPRATAGRLFIDGDSVGLILGMVHDTFLTSTFAADPARIRTGSRLTPQETEHRIVPGGAVSLAVAGRGDWAKISSVAWTGTYGMPMVQAPAPAQAVPVAAATPMAAPAPAAVPMTPAASVAAAAPQDPNQIEQRFAALKRLLDNHMISQDEYDHAKADLLKAMATLPPR